MKTKFYLTTPLYYVNSKPHIGHAYTEIAADTLARFQRLAGREVFFLTGTDEHGQKVYKAAETAGLAPQEFTDEMVGVFRELWKTLGISYDDFIRTTEPRHVRTVQAVWRKLHEKGEIYKDAYSGWYCTPCETFFSERQVVQESGIASCPDCKKSVDKLEEENYFLKISSYQNWLMDWIRSHPGFILPETRRNEVMGFLDNNTLQDLCISRPKNRLSWGIPCPLSADHVTYVWFDALINYISACGWPDEARFKIGWPADVHLIGKDILRHHAVYWPIILKALGLEPPKMIFAHGWWVQGGEKMSKSRGNVIDPVEIVKDYGVDPLRYFLLREASFGSDGAFSEEALILRFNNDLANDLGNLLHRTLTMCEKYFEGNIPAEIASQRKGPLREKAENLPSRLHSPIERLAFSEALTEIWLLVNEANKSIETRAPWKMAKEGKTEELRGLMVEWLEVLRVVAQTVWPFMPSTGEAIWRQLGLNLPVEKFGSQSWGVFEKGGKIAKGAPLFPRIEARI